MIHLRRRIHGLLRAEEGPTAVEYAVLLALILLALIGGIRLLKDGVQSMLTNAGNVI